MSRISWSSVPPPPARLHRQPQLDLAWRRVEDSRCGVVARGDGGARPLDRCRSAGGAAAASAASGARPRNTSSPCRVAASSDTRPGCSRRHCPAAAAAAPRSSVTRVLPLLSPLGPDPCPHVLAATAPRSRSTPAPCCTGLATSGVGFLDSRDVVGRVSAQIALARAHLDAAPLHADLNLVELAVGRRLRRVVAEQVVEARVAHHLLRAPSPACCG